MSFEFLILNGYGVFVWPAFIFTFICFFALYLKTSKELLKASTKELANRGGFGSPTIFIDEKNMFFGNDRLNLIEKLQSS